MTCNQRPQRRLIKITSHLALTTILATTLSACGMFDSKEEEPDYLKSKSSPPLVIPEGLQFPEQNHEFDITAQASPGPVDLKALKKLEHPPEMDKSLIAELDAKEAEKSAKDEDEALMVRTARNTEGYDLLVVEADFDLCWDRVGTALKKIGFKIEDSDQDSKIYVIYQNILREMTDEEEFLRPRGDKGPREEYQVHLEDRDTQTRISVHNQNGKPDDSALAKHLLVQLRATLEKPQ